MSYVWGILAFVFFIFSLIMFLGLINPNIINKRIKENQKPFTRKRAAIFWIASGIIFFIFFGLANPSPDKGTLTSLENAPSTSPKSTKQPDPTKEPKAPAIATIKPTPQAKNTATPTVDPAIKKAAEDKAKADTDAQKKKDQQDIVLKFEQKIYDTEKPASLAIKNYQDVFQKFGNGTVTINDAYQAATDANKACKDVQYAMGTLSTPSGLPKDVSKTLSDATNDISTSYFTTSEAFDEILKYLDDQKPSYIQKYKDSMSMANSFIISGSQKILEAKTKMGIDITAASPNA